MKPHSQEWYDDNRSRFDAETVVAPEPPKCMHDGLLKRKNATIVECTGCHAGWIDLGKWKIEEGRLVGA